MHLTGCGRLAAAVSALVAAVMGPTADTAVTQLGGEDFPAALLAAGQLAGLGLSAWVLLVIATTAARLRLPGVPRSVRTLLFTGVLISATAVPAHASGSHDLDGLPLPDRPVSTAVVEPTRTVTVRVGDTVWAIASADLGVGASTAQVAAACDRWHERNRAVIGPDPDLILPGQVLTPPTPAEDAS